MAVERYGNGRGGRPWRRRRWAVLTRDQFTCQKCKKTFLPEQLACDHIVPLAKGGSDEMENLQALCDGPDSCHEAKTMAEMGIKPSPAIGVDGWPVMAASASYGANHSRSRGASRRGART
jgi:5-methylcytosine-specific restriction protein A